MKRIFAFWDPFAAAKGAGYQLIQSLLAIARGGLGGLGLGEGKQKLFYLPEPHTDFIYAVVGEELGTHWRLVRRGGVRCLALARFSDSHALRRFLQRPAGGGVTFLVTAQGFLNMAVATGLLPTTGIPLPLISLGGSSLGVYAHLPGSADFHRIIEPSPRRIGGKSPLDAAVGWISRARKPVLRRRARS